MSYLAYPPRLPVEFSESIAQLIKLTLKIKNEVAAHKNEFNQTLARRGRAFIRAHRPLDARSCLLFHQVRRSRHWTAFAGEDVWGKASEISIRQLAEDANVSASTSKRWLRALETRGILSSVLKDGQRQFVNEGLVAIIEKYV
jgi:predicted transcriptional regulator